mgnify:CR=1 FL=1
MSADTIPTKMLGSSFLSLRDNKKREGPAFAGPFVHFCIALDVTLISSKGIQKEELR